MQTAHVRGRGREGQREAGRGGEGQGGQGGQGRMVQGSSRLANALWAACMSLCTRKRLRSAGQSRKATELHDSSSHSDDTMTCIFYIMLRTSTVHPVIHFLSPSLPLLHYYLLDGEFSYTWLQASKFRSLMGCVVAPKAGPMCTLLLTDIVSSTALWETLNPGRFVINAGEKLGKMLAVGHKLRRSHAPTQSVAPRCQASHRKAHAKTRHHPQLYVTTSLVNTSLCPHTLRSSSKKALHHPQLIRLHLCINNVCLRNR